MGFGRSGLLVIAISLALVACDELSTTPVAPTAAPAATTITQSNLVCVAATPLAANVPLAARVNGTPISLERYNREVAAAQAALTLQSSASKAAPSQDALKNARVQVLDQMINDIIIAQQAEKEGVKVSDAELNAELVKIVPDGASIAKLNEYLAKNKLSLGDLCTQIRNQLYSAAMLTRVSATVPTQGEQVHARQVLVSSQSLAQTIRDRARKGEDMAALAKQYSIDAVSKANGGDLGWLAKGMVDPRLDAVMFVLPVGQVSDVVTTGYGFAVVQVIEKEPSRALSAQLIQSKKQAVFLTWLQAVRSGAKIEKLVQN